MLTVVTGAQGFLGRHLVKELVARGQPVLAVDMKAMTGPALPGVHYHISDLTDPTTLVPPECEPTGPFTLVHLAWDMRQRESSFRVQAEQVRSFAGLLDAWGDKGLSYLVAPGSAQEYGGRSGRIAEDDLPVEPLSPYGWAKHAAYGMATSWAQRHDIGLLWARPFIVYGPGQEGSMLIPYAVRQALSGEPASFSEGTQVRDFVLVDDVVRALIAGIERRPPGINTVNLGSGDPVEIKTVLTHIAELLGAADQFSFGARGRRAGEPDEQVARLDKARELLGWVPGVGWQEGIERVCQAARP